MNLPNSCASPNRSDDVLRLANFLSHKNLRDEAELITLKWPAYRFLSPWRCNHLFRDAYNAQIAAMSPRNGDGSLSYLGGISRKLDMQSNNSAHTQLHLARQHADRTGMPYAEYLRFCFDFASHRTRGFVPRPNQLRPSPKSEDAWLSSIVEYWTADRMCLSLVREPHLAQFAQENERDLPAQTSFTETLIWLAEENLPGQSTFLGNFVLSRRWMAEHFVAHRFPLSLEKAKADAEHFKASGCYVPEPLHVLDDGELLQSCFGLPGINVDSDVTCKTCPAKNACEMLRTETLNTLLLMRGTSEPVAEKKRQKNRERVAKHRLMKTEGQNTELTKGLVS